MNDAALLRAGTRALSASFRRFTDYLGLFIVSLVLLAAVVGPLSGYIPAQDVNIPHADLGPGPGHWLGTDHLGRDVLSRLVFACQAFVWPGLLACLTAAAIGVPAGATAGYMGGPVEAAIRYVTTVIASLPRFVLVLLVCSIYGNDLPTLALAAGVAYSPTLSEAVYGRIEGLRTSEYLLANRAYGVPEWRIVAVHLVFAACGRLIGRHLVILFGYFLVLETTLSYIGGFGVQEPTPSWGNMLVFEWGRSGSSVAMLAPVVALIATVLAVSWLADVLAEVGHE